jgi:uncharacterized protein YutE (UPF0331/DUF86 family)
VLDKEFIIRKVKLIQEELSHLEEFSRFSLDEITQDYRRMMIVERLLEKIITRAIDINQHIVAETGKGTEKIRGYEDTFLALSQFGVYPQDFARKIAPSAGLRNRLVHQYNELNQGIIYQSISEALEQYAKYCHYILNYLDKQ